MIKITSILKVLLLVITLSIIVSCGEDEDVIVKPDDNPDNQKQDSSEKIIDIVSDPVTVSGKLKILTSDKYNAYDWNLGEQKIISELSVGDSLIQVGEGKIEVSGDFSYTLKGNLSTQHLISANQFAETLFNDINEVVKEPENLSLSFQSLRTYILIDENKKELFGYEGGSNNLDSLGNIIIVPLNKILWRFFSERGKFKIFTGTEKNLSIPYDMDFEKGWNPHVRDEMLSHGIKNIINYDSRNYIYIINE